MTWNGSGTFSRITTTVSPAVGGTTIDVTAQNNYTADVTSGVNACLAKNGENSATGNLDLGGYKITNVAVGTATTDTPSLAQVQASGFAYAADTGAADVYVITLSPVPAAYTAGMVVRMKASATNTGASTINVNSLGAKNIKTDRILDPVANEIRVNGIYTLVYDGTQFQIQRRNHAVFVNSVEGTAGAPVVSSTELVIDTAVTEDTWESVGPTGSSATNTWTALDVVPSGIDWVELRVGGSLSGTTASVQGEIYARKTGTSGTATAGDPTQIWAALNSDGDSDAKTAFSWVTAKVPVDTSGRLDLYWEQTNASAQTLNAWLIGYGWNG